MRKLSVMAMLTALALGVLVGDPALAADGQPSPGQMGLQEAATPVMQEIVWFHNLLLWIIAAIVAFVFVLMAIIVFKFNAKANPTPAKFTHNVGLEVAWTLIPVLILVGIAIPSFRLLYKIEDIPPADLTVKATGASWNWIYEYPEIFPEEEFISLMVEDEDLGLDYWGAPQPRLLATDFDVVVPVGKVVRMQITGADVIHSWAIPAFGVKMDAVPGRLNETWFQAEEIGMYYGQCSELCGQGHAFMPISVRVVSEEEFAAWVDATKQELGIAEVSDPAIDVSLADIAAE